MDSSTDIFHIPQNIQDKYVQAAGGRAPETPWKFAVCWDGEGYNEGSTVFFPFPETLGDFLVNDYGITRKGNNEAIFFQSNIPRVKVRSYFQDTVTNQVLNWLDYFIKGTAAISETNSFGQAAEAVFGEFKSCFNNAKDFCASFAQKWSTSGGMIEVLKQLLAGVQFPGGPVDGDHDLAVLHLPYVLYYKLLGARTVNIFEFPAYIKSGFMDADGMYGWNDEDAIGGLLPSINGRGNKYLDFLMKGMNANFMPMFNPHSGKSDYMQCVIEFDLINDTMEKAKRNYEFVHTLILNNMWIQYGFVQGPACLYDVNIIGGNRFFMCSGDFKVSYKGTLRNVSTFGNDKMLPDAYHLQLTFKSLLPNNFNNYMMAKLASEPIIYPGETVKGAFGTIADNAEKFVKSGSAEMGTTEDTDAANGFSVGELNLPENFQNEYGSELGDINEVNGIDNISQNAMKNAENASKTWLQSHPNDVSGANTAARTEYNKTMYDGVQKAKLYKPATEFTDYSKNNRVNEMQSFRPQS